MKITVLNDVGDMYDLEIDPQMSLENMMALLEAEVRSTFTPLTKITENETIIYSLASPSTSRVCPSMDAN